MVGPEGWGGHAGALEAGAVATWKSLGATDLHQVLDSTVPISFSPGPLSKHITLSFFIGLLPLMSLYLITSLEHKDPK